MDSVSDWIYYNSFAHRGIGENYAWHIAASVINPIPGGHPICTYFFMTPDGLVDDSASRNRNFDGQDHDSGVGAREDDDSNMD